MPFGTRAKILGNEAARLKDKGRPAPRRQAERHLPTLPCGGKQGIFRATRRKFPSHRGSRSQSANAVVPQEGRGACVGAASRSERFEANRPKGGSWSEITVGSLPHVERLQGADSPAAAGGFRRKPEAPNPKGTLAGAFWDAGENLGQRSGPVEGQRETRSPSAGRRASADPPLWGKTGNF